MTALIVKAETAATAICSPPLYKALIRKTLRILQSLFDKALRTLKAVVNIWKISVFHSKFLRTAYYFKKIIEDWSLNSLAMRECTANTQTQKICWSPSRRRFLVVCLDVDDAWLLLCCLVMNKKNFNYSRGTSRKKRNRASGLCVGANGNAELWLRNSLAGSKVYQQIVLMNYGLLSIIIILIGWHCVTRIISRLTERTAQHASLHVSFSWLCLSFAIIVNAAAIAIGISSEKYSPFNISANDNCDCCRGCCGFCNLDGSLKGGVVAPVNDLNCKNSFFKSLNRQ